MKKTMIFAAILLGMLSTVANAAVKISVTVNPAQFGNAYLLGSNDEQPLTQGQEYTIVPGVHTMLEALYDYGWQVDNWTRNDTIIGTETRLDISDLTEDGLYEIVLNLRYHPADPGALPQGTLDKESGHLTMISVGAGQLYSNYLMLKNIHRWQYSGLYNYNGEEKYITSCTVSGEMYAYDANALSELNYLVTLDLSGVSFTEGMVESYLYGYSDHLQTLRLGEDILQMEDRAFSNLSSLQDIHINTLVPPTVEQGEDPFYHCGNGTNYAKDSINLHVYPAALEAYQTDPYWSQFNIVVNAGTTGTLTVNVCDANLGFEGAYVQVEDLSGNKMVQPVGSNCVLTFPGLPLDEYYYATLYTADGREIDSEIRIRLQGDLTIDLTNEANMAVMPIQVKAGGDTWETWEDVTDMCAITWHYGNLTASGMMSMPVPTGDSLCVSIVPMGDIAAYYYALDTCVQMDGPGSNGIFAILTPKVIDRTEEEAPTTGCVHVFNYADCGDDCLVMVFDSVGSLVNKSALYAVGDHHENLFCGMGIGNYAAVVMKESEYTTATQLSQLLAYNLTENSDYAYLDFDIEGGDTVNLVLQFVPAQEILIDSYIEKGSFLASKNSLLVGTILTLTGSVEFIGDYVGDINNLKWVVSLPEHIQVVENSVLVGSNQVPFTLNDGILTIPVGMVNVANKEATALRMCVIADQEGTYYPSASVSYNYRRNEYTSPVGNAYFEAEAITISAPKYTIVTDFIATGIAPARSTVKIVTAEGDTIGTTQANALGKYVANCLVEADESRVFTIHAVASSSYVREVKSATTDVEYDAAAAVPVEISISHFNNWYHNIQEITWHVNNCTTTGTHNDFYYYYHSEDFTFTCQMSGTCDSLCFVSIGMDGSRTVIPAEYLGSGKWSAVRYINTYTMPVRVDLIYVIRGTEINYTNCRSVSAIADPSGYVYEAVSSNRLPGVTATAWTKENEDATPHAWAAEEAALYEEINPQITDEAGGYGWDVPMGLWQVRFHKDGYQDTATAWLPVPPPQMEVNMPLVRYDVPAVKAVNAYEDKLNIEFDHYMMPEDLTAANITVTDGATEIAGTVTLLNEEARTLGDTITFASKVRFTPATAFTASSVTLNIAAGVRSYAGVPMAAYSQAHAPAYEVKTFGQTDTIYVQVGNSVARTFYALPANASVGKTMRFDAMGAGLYTLSAQTATIAADGAAQVSVQGLMPGTTMLRLTVEGTELEEYVVVVVRTSENPNPSTAISNSVVPVELPAEKILENGNLRIRVGARTYNAVGAAL